MDKQIARQLRLIAILDSAERVGLTPLDALALHTLAYFTDALAPVWHLPVMDAQILKRARPYYPSLQDDLDGLVGRGVVRVTDLRDARQSGGAWRLQGKYELHRMFSDPILEVAARFEQQQREIEFVREVVYAASGFGIDNLDRATEVDALYGDELVAVGNIVDVANEGYSGPNASAAVALRFGRLVDASGQTSSAEMIHLYVRQLYNRIAGD